MQHRKILSVLICVVLLAIMLVPMFGIAAVNAAAGKTVYVSSTGSDDNDGSESAPFATFEKAWENSEAVDYTIIVDSATLASSNFSLNTSNKATHTTIKGATASSSLDLSVKTAFAVRCSGGITFDQITVTFKEDTVFAANGRNLVVTETVTMPNRIRVFGGGYTAAISSDTNMTILGGSYNRIYGGGYGGDVNGDVYLTIGGNVNSGDGIDDSDEATYSPCQVFGGCYNGSVNGDVTVNFGESAVARIISANGAGTGSVNGKATVNMTGGKVNTVCGTRSYEMTDAEIYINVTGGLCEAIFGGGQSTSITGDVQIYLGANADVSRRVFGGCYNDYGLLSGWGSDNHVIGSVTVLLELGAKVGSGTELSSGNKIDMGLYGSSRYKSAFSDEICTLVFLNGNTSSNYTLGGSFTDYTDYKVTVGTGGTVTSAMNGTAALTLLPDDGKVAQIDSTKYWDGATYSLSASNTNIAFVDNIEYNVTLYANNGTDETEVIKKNDGFDLTLPKTSAFYNFMEFVGWATTADATEAEYKAGDVYTANADIDLYAVWQEVPVEYSVMHILKTDEGTTVLKTEKLTGKDGEKTDAKALEMAGYVALSIPQETLSRDEIVFIMVTYVKGDFSVGDVNCDGSIDMLDVALLDRFAAGWDGYDASNVCDFTSDCNADGTIDATDAEHLVKYLAGCSGYTLP